MRIASIAVLTFVSALALAEVTVHPVVKLSVIEVDLDKPGALEALAQERPDHYRKVMEAIEKAQAIELEPKAGIRDALMDDRSKGAAAWFLTDPAQRKISVLVEMTAYRVSVRLVKDPARLEKAQ